MILGYRYLAVTREEVPMGPWRQHAIDFVNHLTLQTFHHKVALEVVYVEVKFDRFERIVVGVVITNATLVHKVMLCPPFTHPAIWVQLKFKGFLVFDNSTLHGGSLKPVKVWSHEVCFRLTLKLLSFYLWLCLEACKTIGVADCERFTCLDVPQCIYFSVIALKVDSHDLLILFEPFSYNLYISSGYVIVRQINMD